MTVPDLLLPEGSVLLHIGPRKTGTTTIQKGLRWARKDLAQYGVAYPAVPEHRGFVAYDQTRAATPSWAVTQFAPPGFEVPDISVWEQFAKRVRSASDQGKRVCVSSEAFGSTRQRAKLERIITDLGGDRVHVLATSRALHKVLPSHWQQQVKVTVDDRNYDEWLEVVFGDDKRAAGRAFWHAQDAAMATKAWVRAAGPANFTLVVSDDSDRDLLPNTVAGMLGIPVDIFMIDSTNRSLTLAETEVLRRLNETARTNHWSATGFTTLERGAIRGLRGAENDPAAQRTPPFPEWVVPELLRRSQDQRELVESLGVRIIGDPACLVPSESELISGVPDPVDSVPMSSAVVALSGTMEAAYARDEQRRLQLESLRRSYDEAVAQRLRRAPLRELLAELLKRPARRLLGRAERPMDWDAFAPATPAVEVVDPIPGRDDAAPESGPLPAQPEGEAVDEGLPRRLDDVVADTDGHP